jgi:hypothetical protein
MMDRLLGRKVMVGAIMRAVVKMRKFEVCITQFVIRFQRYGWPKSAACA